MKFNLHRSGKQPDWLQVKEQNRNNWQKLAYRTDGLVTPANGITLVGFVVALTGLGMMLTGHFWWVIILLSLGRLLDVADGVVADKTGTKSALGEMMDAVVDKVVTGLTVIALFVAQTAPWWLLVLLVLPHVIITAIVLVGRWRTIKIHPSRLGKTAMLLVWIAVPLILLLNALSLTWPHPLVVTVYGFTLVTAAISFVAAYGYLAKSARLSASAASRRSSK